MPSVIESVAKLDRPLYLLPVYILVNEIPPVSGLSGYIYRGMKLVKTVRYVLPCCKS